MNKEKERKQWERMLFSLTDPDEREKSRRVTERKERIEAKIKDVGL